MYMSDKLAPQGFALNHVEAKTLLRVRGSETDRVRRSETVRQQHHHQ
jgi:hypothetical protein